MQFKYVINYVQLFVNEGAATHKLSPECNKP